MGKRKDSISEENMEKDDEQLNQGNHSSNDNKSLYEVSHICFKSCYYLKIVNWLNLISLFKHFFFFFCTLG